jgi:hypothetical protein
MCNPLAIKRHVLWGTRNPAAEVGAGALGDAQAMAGRQGFVEMTLAGLVTASVSDAHGGRRLLSPQHPRSDAVRRTTA